MDLTMTKFSFSVLHNENFVMVDSFLFYLITSFL